MLDALGKTNEEITDDVSERVSNALKFLRTNCSSASPRAHGELTGI